MTDDLRFPVGKFAPPSSYDGYSRATAMERVAAAPAALRAAVQGLTDEQLDTPYRPDGWTVRQVVHHVADSHMHAYLRTKSALVEDNPDIKAYDEDEWARLPDGRGPLVTESLALLDALHARWVATFRAMSPEQFQRTMRHSERGDIALDFILELYAWHGRHHVAHVTGLRSRKGWQ
ncbi:MAG: metal-dependent hydrolase [Gemmatimonadetes bacterium]|nr:metal-dependent hydrolase [Gemmatimonadota bacterium]